MSDILLLGEIKLLPFNFAPEGWAFCDGQLLNISQYEALFSLLGTTYGGDGRTTFGLPDLRGRVPIGAGEGQGLPPIRLGERLGGGTVKVDVDSTGGQPIENGQPSLGLHYAIALEGTYPSRP